MILPHYSYLLAGLIPQARVKIYPDSAHGFLFQHHAEFAGDVDEFLTGPGDTGQPYKEFRARYQDAVPELDPKRLAAFAERGAPWPEVIADADASAPHGFLIYWRSDLTPVMSLAGDPARCTAYLMGNHTIAEQMYRHDPSVMLYAPLRTAIYVDAANRTRFAIDKPSTVFASFASPPISQVGIELDHKLAALLDTLNVPAGGALDRPA